MPLARPALALASFLVVATLVRPVAAQESTSAPGSPQPTQAPATQSASNTTEAAPADDPAPQPLPEPPPQKPGVWGRTKEHLRFIGGGQNTLLLPFYAAHMPWKYSGERRAEFNSWTFGGGYARTAEDENGHESSLYGVASQDSFERLQVMFGYVWQKRWRPWGGHGRIGAGYTFSFVSRERYYDRIPLPIVLPVASIGFSRVDLHCTYVLYHEVAFLTVRVKM